MGTTGAELDLTWQRVLLAALGLIGTTVLSILVTKLVNWLLQRRSQLIVEVRVNEVLKASKLLSDLKEAMRPIFIKYDDREKLPLWHYDRYSKYFDNEQYIKLEIANNTPKKITALTVSLDASMTSLMQIGEDGDIVDFPGKAPIALGDLQPKRKVVVNILTSRLLSTFATDILQKAIVFSSDEHVRISYNFRRRST